MDEKDLLLPRSDEATVDSTKWYSWRQHYLLYLDYALSSWARRMYDFALYLTISLAFPDTLVLPALVALVGSASVVFLGPYVSTWIDIYPRWRLMSMAMVTTNLSSGISYALVLLLHRYCRETNPHQDTLPWTEPLFLGLVIPLVLLTTVTELSAMLCSVGLSKNWVLVIVSSNDPSIPEIHHINAMLKRISLIAKTLAPLFFSFLASVFPSNWYFMPIENALIVLFAWTICTAIWELLVLSALVDAYPKLDDPPVKILKKCKETPGDESWLERVINPFRTYYQQSVFLVSFAYSLLFMTVLAPSTLLTNYLAYRRMEVTQISAFQATASLFGILATFVAPYFIEWFGLGWSGIISLYTQALLNLSTTIQLFILPYVFNLPNTSDWFLLIPVILARAPLWIFDLCEVQIMQLAVPTEVQGVVNGCEYSLTAFMELATYVISIVAVYPTNYKWLSLVSIALVFSASVLFTIWYFKYSNTILVDLTLPKKGGQPDREDGGIPLEEK